MNTSVTRSVAARAGSRGDRGLTSPVDQMPKRLEPRARARRERGARARAAGRRGRARRWRGRSRRARGPAAGRAARGTRPPPPCAPRPPPLPPPPARGPRARRRRRGSSSRVPTWPSRATGSRRSTSSTAVACVGRDGRSARQRALVASPARARRRAARPSARSASSSASPHATPTWTSRKRAGAAPCETCMTWPGSPLPQFVSPQARHSAGPQTASSEPQNRGPIPA